MLLDVRPCIEYTGGELLVGQTWLGPDHSKVIERVKWTGIPG